MVGWLQTEVALKEMSISNEAENVSGRKNFPDRSFIFLTI